MNGPSKVNDIFFSWFVVCCGIVGAINLAKLAPSMGRLIDHFNISLSLSGFLGAIFSILMIFTGLLSGIIISKYGPRLAMITGLFISFLGSILPLLNTTLTNIMIGRACEGYGFLLINLSAPVLLTLHTKIQNRGKVMGIWGSFMPAGNALIILIAPIVYVISDWWLLWEISAFFTIMIFFLAYFIIPKDPKQFKESFSEKLTFIVFEIIKKKNVVIIGLTFACHSLIFLGNMQFLPYFFERINGYSATFSYLATASYCLISFLGHLFCGFLLNKGYKPQNLFIIAFTIAGFFVAFFFGSFDSFFPFYMNPLIKLFSILMVSFFMGLTPPTIFYLISYVNPPSRMTPINYGYMVQIQALGIFAGSFLFGLLVDLTGNWGAIGYLCILISICGIFGGVLGSHSVIINSKEK